MRAPASTDDAIRLYQQQGSVRDVPARIQQRPVVIAVVIPFFQRVPGILRRALESVTRQQWFNSRTAVLRIIVVDDQSPIPAEQDCQDLPLPADASLTIIHRPNGGPAAARNTGLDSVPEETDLVAFLDSDDVWSEDHLCRAAASLGEECDLYFCDNQPAELTHTYFEELHLQSGFTLSAVAERGCVNADKVQDRHDRACLLGPAAALDLFFRYYIAHTSTIVFRHARLGDLRFDCNLRYAGEDYLYAMQTAAGSRRVSFSTSVGCYRGNGVNIYMEAVNWGHVNNLRLILDNLRCFLAARALAGSATLRRSVAIRVREYRTEFLYAFIRRMVISRQCDVGLARQACCADPSLIAAAPFLLSRALLLRLRRRPVVDHFTLLRSDDIERILSESSWEIAADAGSSA